MTPRLLETPHNSASSMCAFYGWPAEQAHFVGFSGRAHAAVTNTSHSSVRPRPLDHGVGAWRVFGWAAGHTKRSYSRGDGCRLEPQRPALTKPTYPAMTCMPFWKRAPPGCLDEPRSGETCAGRAVSAGGTSALFDLMPAGQRERATAAGS